MAANPRLEEARKFLDKAGMPRYGWLPAGLQIGLHDLHKAKGVTTLELQTIGKNLVALAAHKDFIHKELMPRVTALHKTNPRAAVQLLLNHSASEAALLSLAKPQLQIELHHGMQSLIGQVRKTNEDFILVDDKKRLYVVADGMGGHAAGEIAAQEASARAVQVFNGGKRKELVAAVQAANTRVYHLNTQRKAAFQGTMGTTLTALHIDPEGEAHIAHVGDTRVYLHREGQMTQLTLDQSHPLAQNYLLRCIGEKDWVTPHAVSVDTEDGDHFLMCSDGLNKHVKDEEIRDALDSADDPQVIADRLVALANSRGGRDNITALVIKVVHKRGIATRP